MSQYEAALKCDGASLGRVRRAHQGLLQILGAHSLGDPASPYPLPPLQAVSLVPKRPIQHVIAESVLTTG